MYSKSNHVKIMVGIGTFDFIKELIGSIVIRYQDSLDELINDSDFVSDSIITTCPKLH